MWAAAALRIVVGADPHGASLVVILAIGLTGWIRLLAPARGTTPNQPGRDHRQYARQFGRDAMRPCAAGRVEKSHDFAESHDSGCPAHAESCDSAPHDASGCENSPGRTRTSNFLIQSQAGTYVSGENSTCYKGRPGDPSATPSNQESVESRAAGLELVAAAWTGLPDPIRVGIIAIVKASSVTR